MTYIPPNVNGQATMANSEPVVIASDQSAVPVSLASVPSHAVTNAGTFAVQNTAATPAGTNNIGDVDVLTLPSIPAGTNNIGDVDIASIAAGDNNIGNVDVVTLPALPAGTNNIGDVDVLTVNGVAPAFGSGVRGATVQRVTIATDDSVPVTLASVPSHPVTNAGTFVTQENGALLTAAQLLDDTIFADDASFTLGTSKGSIAAGVSVAMDGTDPLAVSAEGDSAALRSDPNRILLINQTHPRFFRACVDYAAAQTNATVVAAPGASLSLYITDLVISNGATAGNITLLDGSGGALLFELYPAVNGGVSMSFRNPIKLTANTLLATTSTTVTTHAITVTGYIAA